MSPDRCLTTNYSSAVDVYWGAMNRHKGHRALGLAAAAIVSGGLIVAAQADAPTFDVVSVKPNTQGAGGPTFVDVQPGGRFIATNIPLAFLIGQAYRVQQFQITGAPAWMASERFDIEARASGELATRPDPNPAAPPGRLQLMLRAMLADRFKLKTHIEPRESQAYDLVLARADKKLGPKLVPSEVDCAAEQAAARAAGGPAPAFPPAGAPMRCGMRMMPGNISGGAIPLTQLALQLSNITGKTVTDRTGLAGNFDVNLSFLPDRLPPRPAGTPDDQPIVLNGVAIDPNGPNIFTAVQEQLGLRLEAVKGSIDMLVIDNLEHPTSD